MDPRALRGILRLDAVSKARLAARSKLEGAERSIFAYLVILVTARGFSNVIHCFELSASGRRGPALELSAFMLALAGLLLVALPGTATQSVNAESLKLRRRLSLSPLRRPLVALVSAAAILRGPLLPVLVALYLASAAPLLGGGLGEAGLRLAAAAAGGLALALVASSSIALLLGSVAGSGPRFVSRLAAKSLVVAVAAMDPKFRIEGGSLEASLFFSGGIPFDRIEPVLDILVPFRGPSWPVVLVSTAALLAAALLAVFGRVSARGGRGPEPAGRVFCSVYRFLSRLRLRPAASYFVASELSRLEPFLLFGLSLLAAGSLAASAGAGPAARVAAAWSLALALLNAARAAGRAERARELYARAEICPLSRKSVSRESWLAAAALFALEWLPIAVALAGAPYSVAG